ncbi:MAG: alanine dehydrogenase [Deltaproteobacteria bacterium HGW-Deltaproteobacteria-4]|nr:MAG: alanine dehydrogenase [Deltaproteobacteria bacterium HGW-Deltaproteobacteria-4]
MIVGVAREIKAQEYRVGMTPAGVRQLAGDGNMVLVEHDAGTGSGFDDDDYASAGATLVTRLELFARSELLIKVKEPLPAEYELLRPQQILFTYLHLAPNRPLVNLLLKRNLTAFAYETLEEGGRTPLLTPMSEIAGRMAPLVGAFYLQRPYGGSGLLPGGVPGVPPARALILGAGVVGQGAARIAIGLGMETIVLNRGSERLRQLDRQFSGTIQTRILNDDTLEEELSRADLIIGALYSTGGRTPLLITRERLQTLRTGTVIVDVAIDQGGCAASSRPTTHDNPVYEVNGILHYCVANMPGAYPRTSTLALTNATLPYIRQLAKSGVDESLRSSRPLATALNLRAGAIIHPALAAAYAAGAEPDHK